MCIKNCLVFYVDAIRRTHLYELFIWTKFGGQILYELSSNLTNKETKIENLKVGRKFRMSKQKCFTEDKRMRLWGSPPYHLEQKKNLID